MANISDAIEKFILTILAEDDEVQLSRNDLASYFSVAPSQINYVLSTRFTFNKGFATESRRGGGGFILLQRLVEEEGDTLKNLINECENEPRKFTQQTVFQIIERLLMEKIFCQQEAELLKATLSDRALCVAPTMKETLRANIFREALIDKIKKVVT